jgi:hypothetical protein
MSEYSEEEIIKRGYSIDRIDNSNPYYRVLKDGESIGIAYDSYEQAMNAIRGECLRHDYPNQSEYLLKN